MAKKWAKKFYKSKPWQYARQQALKRDCYTCADCGGRAEEVHHIVELTESNINDISISLNVKNLISLCHNCHTRRTKGSIDCDQNYIFDSSGQLVPLKPPPLHNEKNGL